MYDLVVSQYCKTSCFLQLQLSALWQLCMANLDCSCRLYLAKIATAKVRAMITPKIASFSPPAHASTFIMSNAAALSKPSLSQPVLTDLHDCFVQTDKGVL